MGKRILDKMFHQLKRIIPDKLKQPIKIVYMYIKNKFIHLTSYLTILHVKMKIKSFKYNPLISIIMPVYNVKEELLKAAINSVIDQIYDNWELCIVDDASTVSYIRPILNDYSNSDNRIKVIYLDNNLHIAGASNKALEMANGEYIALFDNDDILDARALYEIVKAMQGNEKYDFLYTDNATIDEKGNIIGYSLKPDWSPEFFLSTCYTIHLRVLRLSLVRAVGCFDLSTTGAQDIDLICKLVVLKCNILHIPKILYFWRVSDTSVAKSTDHKPYIIENSLKAYNSYLAAKGVSYKQSWPAFFSEKGIGAFKISCRDIDFHNISIIVLNGDNENNKVLAELSKIKGINKANITYNLESITDITTKYVLFLDSKAIINDLDFINELYCYLELDEKIACVGSKILSNDNKVLLGRYIFMTTIQILNMNKDIYYDGYWFNNILPHNCLAVSGFCMMTRTDLLLQYGGLDFEEYGTYADIDYCLKAYLNGYRIVFNPWSLVWLEGNYIEDKTKMEKIQQKYKELLGKDPYYNKNFSQKNQYLTKAGIKFG